MSVWLKEQYEKGKKFWDEQKEKEDKKNEPVADIIDHDYVEKEKAKKYYAFGPPVEEPKSPDPLARRDLNKNKLIKVNKAYKTDKQIE